MHLRAKWTMLIRTNVAAMSWMLLLGGPARADVADGPVFSVSATVQEEFEQDNRARELAGQQASLARSDARRGDRTGVQNRIKQALDLAAQIQGERKRTVALVNIATVQAEVGDTEGALQTAHSISNLTERDSTLRTMALDRAKAGDLDNAKRFADAIQDTSKKTDATLYIEAQQSAKPLGY